MNSEPEDLWITLMLILVSDANVLIDIEKGELTTSLFSMNIEFAVPDILYVEELEKHHSHLVDLGLKIKVLSPTSVSNMPQFVRKYTRTSRNDLFALTLALQENCPLLTGDKFLRKAAESEGIIVHRTIWLMAEMIKTLTIDPDIARQAYQKMKNNGSRLPWKEAESTLIELENAIPFCNN